MYRSVVANATGQGQAGQQARNVEGANGPSIGNVGPLPFPLEAVIDATGETVTLLQTCDWPGHSPSNIGIDQYGKQFIASFNEITVTDHRALPNEAAKKLRNRQ